MEVRVSKALSCGVVLFFVVLLLVPVFLDDCAPGRGEGSGDRTAGAGLNEDAVPKDWVKWLKKGGGLCGVSSPPLLAAQAEAESGFKDRPPNSAGAAGPDRKSTRLNSSHVSISYAVFCLKKKKYKYLSLRVS